MIPLTPSSTLFPYTTLFRSPLLLLEANFRAQLVAFQRSCRFGVAAVRSEEHTSELQSLRQLVCRLLLEKKNSKNPRPSTEQDHHCTPSKLHSTTPPSSKPPR